MVAVAIATYNHERFIRQCLDSIIEQRTNFDFHLYIGEDCSKDKTREICLEYKERYPELITLLLTEVNNMALNSKNIWKAVLNSGAKYIAMCDGDDYWTDPDKLQRQVDFLENQTTYSICWTKYKILENDKMIDPVWTKVLPDQERYEINLNNAFTHYCTLTVTCLFRRDCLTEFDLLRFKYFKDNTVYSLCLSKGLGAVLNFEGGIVRSHGGGIYSAASQFNRSYSDYLNYNELSIEIPECNNAHYLVQTRGALVTLFCTYLNKDDKGKPPIALRNLYLNLMKDAPFKRRLFLTKLFVKFSIKQKLQLR
jgi:glycosyltransferase involved in cell wall biosynthesis